uniref:Uncharacterized protein n=1 Tax=Tanacetum cinerariifolium TaxID=118510 RepID=A0A6L2LC79_TANCI|nr:hypothetical protein [Tanacetum cinerariifolium]
MHAVVQMYLTDTKTGQFEYIYSDFTWWFAIGFQFGDIEPGIVEKIICKKCHSTLLNLLAGASMNICSQFLMSFLCANIIFCWTFKTLNLQDNSLGQISKGTLHAGEVLLIKLALHVLRNCASFAQLIPSTEEFSSFEM